MHEHSRNPTFDSVSVVRVSTPAGFGSGNCLSPS